MIRSATVDHRLTVGPGRWACSCGAYGTGASFGPMRGGRIHLSKIGVSIRYPKRWAPA